MNCPICAQESTVLKKLGNERRRECNGCRHRFTTVEKLKDEERLMTEIMEDAQALADKLQKRAA